MNLTSQVDDLFSKGERETAENEVRGAIVETLFNTGSKRFLELVAEALNAHAESHDNLLDDGNVETLTKSQQNEARKNARHVRTLGTKVATIAKTALEV